MSERSLDNTVDEAFWNYCLSSSSGRACRRDCKRGSLENKIFRSSRRPFFSSEWRHFWSSFCLPNYTNKNLQTLPLAIRWQNQSNESSIISPIFTPPFCHKLTKGILFLETLNKAHQSICGTRKTKTQLMIIDRKMHEDNARSWITEPPPQYMTKKKKKGNQTLFLPLKSQRNTHDTHIKGSWISVMNNPNMLQIKKIYMRLEMTRASFCLTKAKKNVPFNPCLCIVCVSHPKIKFHHHKVLTSISNQKSNLIIQGPSYSHPIHFSL